MKKFTYLSWGLGTQSTYLGILAVQGEIEKPDAIVHSDTGWERRHSLEIKPFYTKYFEDAGIPVIVTQAGNIRELGAAEHIHIPFYTSDGGPLRRQCTNHFKIVPQKRAMRKLAGFDATKPPHPKAGQIIQQIGFSYDEYTRMKDSRIAYLKKEYPLIDMKITRNDCISGIKEAGLPLPEKSSCVGCPYRKASGWLDMKINSPDEFADAVAFDKENRHNPLAERGGSTADELYLWRGLIPLDEVDFEAHAKREKKNKQLPLMICNNGCWT